MRGFDLESMSTTVVALARRVAAILDEYVGLHDALYKFSIRHVIPIPGIFKPIDFGAFHAQLGRLTADLLQVMNVLDGLAVDDMRDAQLAETLKEYSVALLDAMENLRSICKRLHDKSQAILSFQLLPRGRDYDAYRTSIQRYKRIAERLNQQFHGRMGTWN